MTPVEFLAGGLDKIDAVFANIASFKYNIVVDVPAKGAAMTSSHSVFLLVILIFQSTPKNVSK